ncbi:hypothetical protein [Desulfohalovibrio reitneri]|uniref:hypothetical protein n=1 Tax=Desulfohalovibrio reitneri TaxID=1307759 RepID=UPI0004A6B99E|nr:hypothetical protein [Desulfohalovibrio reitneri]
MANQDYPGVCMACTTEDCKVVAPDLSAVRERLSTDPLSDYTRNVVNNLTYAMPDKFKDEFEAYMAFDVVKAVIAMGLKNKDTVAMHGLGTFRMEGGKVVFTPDPALEAAAAE